VKPRFWSVGEGFDIVRSVVFACVCGAQWEGTWLFECRELVVFLRAEVCQHRRRTGLGVGSVSSDGCRRIGARADYDYLIKLLLIGDSGMCFMYPCVVKLWWFGCTSEFTLSVFLM
jgi:hypothetical protein